MAYKGSLGTPVNIIGGPKSKTTISCRNCKYYRDKWCSAFNITCSSLANARRCNKFKNKHGEKIQAVKSVRCSTCEFIYFDTVPSGKSKKTQRCTYKCSKKNQHVAYNKVGACANYQKKVPKEKVGIGKIYKKGSEEYKQLISEMEGKINN